MKQQRGFTLIELVVVIIILGILAAVAVPKFVDMSADARNAAAKGVGGAIASGTAVNYAAKAAGNASATALSVANVCTSTLLQPYVSGVTLTSAAATSDTEFQIAGTGDCTAATAATSVTCTVTAKGGAAQNATVMCAR